jgi:hypothetical protein
MKKTVLAVTFLALICQSAIAVEVTNVVSSDKLSQDNQNIGNTIVVDVKKQDWQVRRLEYLNAVKKYLKDPNDKEALSTIDKALTAYEKQSWSITPMEAMDLIQTFYVPQEGIKKTMNMIVAEAILGYKDTLQWASASGKSEILWNEQFLTRAITNGGRDKKRMDEWLKLVEDKPDEAKKIVAEGVRYAKLMNSAKVNAYDRKWPTAYGLERMSAALENKPDNFKETPNISDDKALDDAIAKISAYYLPKSIISKEAKK